jgi:SAM-dependent methyltransferase
MTACPACGSGFGAGLRAWHRPCAACAYEASTLEPRILAQAPGGDLDEAAREDALQALRTANFRTLAGWLPGWLPGWLGERAAGRPRLLEVGCAHGWFLQATQDRFDVLGIEPDPHVANAGGRAGLPIRPGFFPEALAPDERFDAIVFNDVLEHIPDLAATLRACHQRLTPGGLLVVNAPDARGFLYRLSKWLVRAGFPASFDRLWQAGFPSPHVHYFSDAPLEAICRRAGFTPVARRRLRSVSASGLYSRLRYSRDSSRVGALLMTGVITAAIPLLAILPPDIGVWAFRRE